VKDGEHLRMTVPEYFAPARMLRFAAQAATDTGKTTLHTTTVKA
jgi:hypothetical protein